MTLVECTLLSVAPSDRRFSLGGAMGSRTPDLFHAMPAWQGVRGRRNGFRVSVVIHPGTPVIGVAVAQLVAQSQDRIARLADTKLVS
jgi:hypothetical protein